MGLTLCAEQHVGNLKRCTFKNSGTPVHRTRRRISQHWTFKNSGTPVCRTKRRKSQQMHFQELWDSCAQNKTSEISRDALSEIVGLQFAEPIVGNLKHMHVQNVWDFGSQNKTSEISKNVTFVLLLGWVYEEDLALQLPCT